MIEQKYVLPLGVKVTTEFTVTQINFTVKKYGHLAIYERSNISTEAALFEGYQDDVGKKLMEIYDEGKLKGVPVSDLCFATRGLKPKI